MKNLLLLPIILLFACSSGDDTGEPIVLTEIELVAVDQELKVGDKYQMKVNFTPSNVGNLQCVWGSSDTNVATVSQKGLLDVKGYGVSTITAAYGGLTTNTSVAVPQPQDHTSFVVFTNEDVNLINSVAGYYNNGLCLKLGDLGDLTKGKHSSEITVTIDTLTRVYIFSDYPSAATKTDTVLVLKKNYKNIFQLQRYTKGIRVDKSDPTQYPQ